MVLYFLNVIMKSFFPAVAISELGNIDIYGRFFQDGIELINNAKNNVFSKCKNEELFLSCCNK